MNVGGSAGRRAGLLVACAIVLVSIAGEARALDPARSLNQYIFRSWGLEEGLPQTSANAIVQAPDGYIYIATFGGLVRFDGVRMTLVPGDGSCSNRLYALEVDGEGVLWAGTERAGLCRMRGGALVAFPVPDGREVEGVGSIRQSRQGGVWVASMNGLLRIEGERVERYGMAHGLPSDGVVSIAEAADGTLWVGTHEGPCLFRGNRCEEPEWLGGLRHQRIEAMHIARNGDAWIGSKDGLFVVRRDRLDRIALAPGFQRVRTALEDADGNIWVGLQPGGLRRVSADGEEISRDVGIVTDTIASFLEDREGNVWIGFTNAGIGKLSDGRAIGLRVPDESASVPVLPIAGDGRGGAWVGTACSGVAHVTPSLEIEMIDQSDGLANPCVWSLLAAADGGVWIGSHGHGLFRLRADGRVESRGGPKSREQVVRALAYASDGAILVGTDDGLYRHDPARGGFEQVDGTQGADIHFVLQSDDAVRLGTRTGMLTLRPSGVEVLGRAHGLSADYVRAIVRDPDGVLWLGTYGGGLNRVEGGRITVFDMSNGLPENVVSRIIEDDRGRFWLTGNRGVTRVSRTGLEAVAKGELQHVAADLFDVGDGMPVSETNGGGQPAGSLLDDGRLWIPTVDGIAIFDTKSEVFNAVPPPVKIEEIIVDGRRLSGDRRIVLEPGARNLEIHYTALSFRSPERVRFRYRLEGFDEKWIEPGTRRVAYYPFIPSGDLVFRVTASNDDGVWNEEGETFSFTRRPRFVETGLFYGLIALVAAILGGLVFWLRGMAADRARETLARQVDERTAELAKLAELAEQINQAVTLEEVLDHVYESLREVIPYDRIGLALMDDNRVVLRAVWSRSESAEIGIGQGYEAPLEGSSLMKVLEAGEPRIIADLEKYLEEHPDSESTRRILREGIRSSMTCPLKALGRPVGFLFFSSASRNTYGPSHVRFLQQIAGQLSLVVGKSKLYEDLLDTKKRLEDANRNLETLAAADGLTGIPNRRSFDQRLDEEWRRAIRSRAPLSLLMIDVDEFKAYNDQYGHAVGDDCLRTIATVLGANLRRVADMVARFGGEEFAVILPDTDEASARMMAERLRSGVEGLRMQHGASKVSGVVTISVGGATVIPTSDGRLSELIEAADAELYEVKHAGRNGTRHRTLAPGASEGKRTG